MEKVKPQVKRMNINGKIYICKYEMILLGTTYIEKDKKKGVYNFYFPQDAPNNVYVLGVAMPIDLLDAYVAGRMSNLANSVAQGVLKKKLPDIEIGDK